MLLAKWSREVFGDIFKQLVIWEDVVKIKEELFQKDPNPTNRVVLQKAQAELKQYLYYEKEYWKEKTSA